MKPIVIPKARQLEAIANGSFMHVLAEYVPDPTVVDIREYISITRDDLRIYLRDNPHLLHFILVRAQCDSLSHDRFCIEHEKGTYSLYWLDHGSKRFGRPYETLEAVVTEYLLTLHGL